MADNDDNRLLKQDILGAAEHYFAAKCALVAEIAANEEYPDDAAHELMDAELSLCEAQRQLNKAKARAKVRP